MAAVLTLENSQVRETFMGTSRMQKIKRQGETHYPSQQAACLAMGNWGELGGTRRSDWNPPSTQTTGSSSNPSRGSRADWFKDQPLRLQGDPAPNSWWSTHVPGLPQLGSVLGSGPLQFAPVFSLSQAAPVTAPEQAGL